MSYAPQSPDLSAVPESAASYYPPHDAFALHYHAKAEPSDFGSAAAPPPASDYPAYPPPPPQYFAHPPAQATGYGVGTAAAAAATAPVKMAPPDDDKPYPGQEQNIVVKTKFPVARIKRIVQADEEVGKVAQVTPVVVSKALELFMIALALSAADQARARNSKRVTAAHLKLAVAQDDQFDFLSEIADKIADAPAPASKEAAGKPGAGGRRRSSISADDDDVGLGDEAPKKRATRGRRKKPKSEDEDDWS